MNRLYVAVACFLMTLITSTVGISQPQDGDETDPVGALHVHVVGLRSSEGWVHIGLYDEASHFANHSGSLRKVVLPIVDDVCEWIFEDVPYGEYAIMLYHDDNGNSLLDRNVFGLPQEPYGFSNNVRPLVRFPSFQETAFSFAEPVKTVEITIR